MGYEDMKLDFVTRTLEIVEGNVAPKRDVTLLINCLLGLIVLLHEKDRAIIPDKQLKTQGVWGVTPNHIEELKCNSCDLPKDELTLKELVQYLRNAVAHVGIQVWGTQVVVNDGREAKKVITHVQFDSRRTKGKKKNRKVYTFRAMLPIKDLRKFAVSLGMWYKGKLEEIRRQQSPLQGFPSGQPNK